MNVGDRVRYRSAYLLANVEYSMLADASARGEVVETESTPHLSIKDWVKVKWDRKTMSESMRKFTGRNTTMWMNANLLEVVSE